MLDDALEQARTRLHQLLSGHGAVDQSRAASRLFAGDFTSSATVGEEFGNSHLGLGVMQDIAGEVVSLHGGTWRIPADGTPQRAADMERLAFGIAAHGGRRHRLAIAPGANFAAVSRTIDRYLEVSQHVADEVICAVEITGTFHDVLLRTVAPPAFVGEDLASIIEHETRFSFAEWHGSAVGFRFPDLQSGITLPGLHLHAISSDERSGGHVRELTVQHVTANIWIDEFHSPRELPDRSTTA